MGVSHVRIQTLNPKGTFSTWLFLGVCGGDGAGLCLGVACAEAGMIRSLRKAGGVTGGVTAAIGVCASACVRMRAS